MADSFEGFLADFALDAQERCERIEELLLSAVEAGMALGGEALEETRRELHTLKGNAGMVGLRELQSAAHDLEDRLAGEPAGPRELLHALDELRMLLHASVGTEGETKRSAEVTRGGVRVPFGALDELVDLLAEIVVFRNRLDDAVGRAAGAAAGARWHDVLEAHDALGATLALLQDHVMALRMVPLRTLFGQLRRIVHDDSAAAGKKTELATAGGDTAIDKALLEPASEALGHLVRNAIAHGIETPADRIRAGKHPTGLVQISAGAHSDEVWIEVQDDGAGIDPAAVAAAAAGKGISAESMRDPLQLLFHSGFSMRESSDLRAGRGVGLSAAEEAVRRAGGDIEIDSKPGRGTRFRIRLPLTLSITRALLVRVDDDEYAVPLGAIVESIRLSASDAHIVNDSAVFSRRGRILPLLDLGLVMASAPQFRTRAYAVVIETDGRGRGLLVDSLIGVREIVVKGLGEIGAPPLGISGATILGDGRVILILDPKSLIDLPVSGAMRGAERPQSITTGALA